jgi:squalene-associated FAD-dependent desaturase
VAAIPRVIILGGGLAGLSAALCLADSGFAVELLEKRAVLGGRASSFLPPGEAEQIDNCQHVLLGCCTNLIDFFRRAGTLHHFRFYNSFVFLGPGGESRMAASALPEPLHLFPSLLRFRDLGWRDKWAIGRAMREILRAHPPDPDEPMIAWLQRRQQTPVAIENFWRVVLTSALNEDLERLSARHAFKVFFDGFLGNRRGYRMGVPVIPLSELYSSESIGKKCLVRLRSPIACIEASEARVHGVRMQDGEERTADFYLSTIPPDALSNLLPPQARAALPGIDELKNNEWSPITGIHLWFDRTVMSREHAAIVGRTIQWVFNRSALGTPNQREGGAQYIQIVVSASRSFLNMKRDDILEICLKELGELFPKTRSATLLKTVIVKEAKSTLSPQPNIDHLRPGPETLIENLFLAGDWTATGWPFTMESAVRSGYRAAELISAAAGKPQTFLQPDLPLAPLVRLLRKL